MLGLHTAQQKLGQIRQALATADKEFRAVLDELGLDPEGKYTIGADGVLSFTEVSEDA